MLKFMISVVISRTIVVKHTGNDFWQGSRILTHTVAMAEREETENLRQSDERYLNQESLSPSPGVIDPPSEQPS